jgi:hypothetical protein
MKKPQPPRRLRVLELDEKEGLLDEESALELDRLREEYQDDLMLWADKANDEKRDEGHNEKLD